MNGMLKIDVGEDPISQALLFIAKSLEIFHSLRSLLTDLSQVSLGRSLPLFTLSTRFRTPLRTGALGDLRWKCQEPLDNICTALMFVGIS
jgi:hypothetical protein